MPAVLSSTAPCTFRTISNGLVNPTYVVSCPAGFVGPSEGTVHYSCSQHFDLRNIQSSVTGMGCVQPWQAYTLAATPGGGDSGVLFDDLDPAVVAQHFGSGFLLVAALWYAAFATRQLLSLVKR